MRTVLDGVAANLSHLGAAMGDQGSVDIRQLSGDRERKAATSGIGPSPLCGSAVRGRSGEPAANSCPVNAGSNTIADM
jgi:hypothetical protein